MKYLVFLVCLFVFEKNVRAEMQTLRFSNGDRISGENLAESESHLTLKTQIGQENIVPVELLESVAPELSSEEISVVTDVEPLRNWSSHVELNSAFSRGNTDSALINFQADYELEMQRHRYGLAFSSVREEKEGDQVKEQDKHR